MEKHGANALIGKYYDLTYVRDGAAPPPDGTPDAPQNLVLTAAGAGSVNLAWAAVPEATGYRVYRRLPGETAWTKIGADAVSPGATVSGQPAGVLMEWTVAAFNEAGEGAKAVPEEITL